MSEPKWTSEDTFKFIELYRNEPTIWNPKNKYHKDKNAVNEAWTRISDAMSIPVKEIKKKKETLLAAFRLNHKKVEASLKSGAGKDDVFKPIWAYYDALAAFMSGIYQRRCILATDDEDSQLINEYPCTEENQVHTNVQSPVQSPVQSRLCQNPTESEETKTQINTALSALTKALKTKSKHEPEDECDMYGKLLAHKLKSYPALERQELMYEIDGLLLKKRKRSRIVSSGSPQIIISAPSSSALHTDYSRPSSGNSNYSTPTHTTITSPSQSSIHEVPSMIYVDYSTPSSSNITVKEETESEDILSHEDYN